MKNIIKLLGVFGILFAAGLTSNLQAQEKNIIKEVQINPADNFKDLKNIIEQNVDFTNPNFAEGKVNSEVKFEVADNGRIEFLSVKGDCKYVNAELEDVMSHLLYTVKDSSKLTKNVYVLPITLYIASR